MNHHREFTNPPLTISCTSLVLAKSAIQFLTDAPIRLSRSPLHQRLRPLHPLLEMGVDTSGRPLLVDVLVGHLQ